MRRWITIYQRHCHPGNFDFTKSPLLRVLTADTWNDKVRISRQKVEGPLTTEKNHTKPQYTDIITLTTFPEKWKWTDRKRQLQSAYLARNLVWHRAQICGERVLSTHFLRQAWHTLHSPKASPNCPLWCEARNPASSCETHKKSPLLILLQLGRFDVELGFCEVCSSGTKFSRRWRRSDGGREVVGAEIPGARSSIPSPAFQGLECTHSPQSAPLSFNSRLTQESVPARLSPRKEQDLWLKRFKFKRRGQDEAEAAFQLLLSEL